MEQKRLAALRRYENISQEKMAKKLGITSRAYIYKEKGQSQFKLNEMFIISRVLKRPIQDIFLPHDFESHEIKEESR